MTGTPNEPKLAPPGAGLPLPELLAARFLLGMRRLSGSPASFTARFVRERETIRRILDEAEPEELGERRLIARPRGLEDSSRNWSVLMTLDHLRIVHHACIGVIGSLSAGKIPEGRASTAAVKPDPATGIGVIADYEESCDALLATTGQVRDFRTALRFPHPWFGPMDAHGWFALASGHLGIHRVQIGRILAAGRHR